MVSSPKLVTLCGDGASFLTLEPGLEEVLNPPLTTLPLVAPSLPINIRDNTLFLMIFPNPPFPLAQSAKFEVGGTFCVDASFDENDICCESNDVFIVVHDFNETLLGKSYVDVMVALSLSPDVVD